MSHVVNIYVNIGNPIINHPPISLLMGDNSHHQMIGFSLGESVNPNGCTMKHEATTPQALT
jgi:hypothetical protein